ncbi:hypothetical protein [Streptomyces rimosus]|uniref:hypothetical protein n=1 Tax=Streptomyces rimosus TaxID=1927 RepID=UPI0037D6DC6B
MTTPSQGRTPAEAAREAMGELADAAGAAGIRFPSLRLDPKPVGEDGVLAHLIDLGRINLSTAKKLTKILEAARK